jgi:hypothetical protein
MQNSSSKWTPSNRTPFLQDRRCGNNGTTIKAEIDKNSENSAIRDSLHLFDLQRLE